MAPPSGPRRQVLVGLHLPARHGVMFSVGGGQIGSNCRTDSDTTVFWDTKVARGKRGRLGERSIGSIRGGAEGG